MNRTFIKINTNSRYETDETDADREKYPVYKYMEIEENCRLTQSIDKLLRSSIIEGSKAKSYLAEVVIPARQYFELLKKDNDLIIYSEKDIKNDDIVFNGNVYIQLHSWNITFVNLTDGYTASVLKEVEK